MLLSFLLDSEYGNVQISLSLTTSDGHHKLEKQYQSHLSPARDLKANYFTNVASTHS